MYLEFYGFKEAPFNLTPDSKFLFLSHRHQEALAALLFGVQERKGFILLTGEIGCGKTTLCRAMLSQLDHEENKVCVVLNSYLTDIELLKTINEGYGLPAESDSKKSLLDRLNDFLVTEFSSGHNIILIIDEAQNLRPETLEQIRMISNLETETAKLIQIVLVGQPELRRTLALPELEQLNQRITVRYHITPLDEKEILDYIKHRLLVAEPNVDVTYSELASRQIYHASRGVPRRINVICDRCLLVGYVQGKFNLDDRVVQAAVAEIKGDSQESSAVTPAPIGAGRSMTGPFGKLMKVIALICLVIGALWVGNSLMAPDDDIEGVVWSTGKDPIQQINLEQQIASNPAGPGRSDTGGPGVSPDGKIQKVTPGPTADRQPRVSPEPEPTSTPQPATKVPPPRPGPTPVPTLTATPTTRPTASPTPSPTPIPTATPTPEPTPRIYANWELDDDGIFRIQADSENADQFKEAAVYLSVARLWNISVDLDVFKSVTPETVSEYDLLSMFKQLNFESYITDELDEALRMNCPVIIQVEPGIGLSEWVSVISTSGDKLEISDPVHGKQRLDRQQLEFSIREAVVLYQDPERLKGARYGETSSRSGIIQKKLAELGLYTGPMDDKFGPLTRQAVLDFQSRNSLEQTGVVDSATAAAINRLLNPKRPRLQSYEYYIPGRQAPSSRSEQGQAIPVQRSGSDSRQVTVETQRRSSRKFIIS